MNVMITGASRGIGLELVRYFAAQPGFRIYALSRNAKVLENLSSTYKSSVMPVIIDVDRIIDDPSSLLQFITDKDFHLDILINNAGNLVNKPFEQLKIPEINQMFRINCIAPAALIKTMLPFMGKNGKTHVVNISSMGGYQGSSKFPGLSWYSASKAALACLTECLSEEYKTSDIVFNCLALGSVQTEMLTEAFPGYKATVQPEEMAEYIGNFALTAHRFFRGKILPVSLSTP
jgi:short-subunit dehydrogenase